MRIAAIQLCSTPDIEANLNKASELIEKAKSEGAELIGLPEHFMFWGNEQERLKVAAELCEKGMAFLSEQASKHKVWLFGAGLPESSTHGEKVYNRFVLFDPNGKCVSSYDKMHLFDVQIETGPNVLESKYIEHGKIITSPYKIKEGLQLGMTICYDLRFSSLYRELTDEGATVLAIPSAFTKKTGEAHWEILVRARAIENQAYVLAPAQCGTHSEKMSSYGHSMIVDPWGVILAEASSENDEVVYADIDIVKQQKLREEFPVLKHRQ